MEEKVRIESEAFAVKLNELQDQMAEYDNIDELKQSVEQKRTVDYFN